MALMGAIFSAGVFASRPAAAAGKDGQAYYATDTLVLYLQEGDAWIEVDTTGSIDAADVTGLEAFVEAMTLDQLAAAAADLDLGGNQLTNVGDPAAAQDAATKAYADAIASSLAFKAGVRAATTANLTLATDLENGDTLDGVTLATGDRVLVKDQSTGSQNGVYVINSSGAPTRAADADSDGDVANGIVVFVSEGTQNADTGWVLTTNAPITVGTTALAFAQFLSATVVSALNDLTDVNAPAPGDGDVLTWDDGAGEWVAAPPAGGAVDAADVTFAPAGGVAATDVQAAIEELDTEKAGAGHNHSGTYQPLDADLTTIAGLTATTDNILQAASSAWASRTPAQVAATLPAVVGDSGAGGTKGLVPAPGAGDAAAGKFLKADGTFAVPPGAGDVAGPASAVDGELALFDSTTGKLIKRATGSGFVQVASGVYATRTAAQATSDLDAMVGDSGSGGTKGLVPAPGAGDAAAGKYLDAAGGFSVPPGSGDPAVATHAASSKATPVDNDELPLVDSAASNVLKKLTWANLKATLKTYLDTLYATVGHTHAGGMAQLSAAYVIMQDDFFGGQASSAQLSVLGWLYGGGSAPTSTQAVANHPGILLRQTGTTSGTVAYQYLGVAGVANGILMSDPTWDMILVFRLNTNDSNTAFRFGVGTNALNSAGGADGMFIEKAAADTNWFYNMRAASADTRTDSGVAVSTNWVTFRIRRTAGGVGCSIDGGSETVLSSGLSSAAGAPLIQIINSANANKTADLDYFCLTLTPSR